VIYGFALHQAGPSTDRCSVLTISKDLDRTKACRLGQWGSWRRGLPVVDQQDPAVELKASEITRAPVRNKVSPFARTRNDPPSIRGQGSTDMM